MQESAEKLEQDATECCSPATALTSSEATAALLGHGLCTHTRIAMDKYPGLLAGSCEVYSPRFPRAFCACIDLAGPIATNAFGFPCQRSSEQIMDLLVQVCSD